MSKTTDISDIYPFEDNIYLSSNFLEKLDDRRTQKYTADKNLLNGPSQVIDIDNILSLPNGRITINFQNTKFECFFHKGKKERLYIILDGARTSSGGIKRDIPRFNRWSYYIFSEYNWLSIEDPMYYDNDDLLLGWFYGTEDKNYREYVAIIANKFSDFLNIEKRDVVFMGGSGGGTAAIHSAALFGNGVAISVNGQVNFEYDYKDIKRFELQTGIDLHKRDKFDRNNLCKVMKDSQKVKYILVENCRSKWDFNDHLKYVVEKFDINPVYGISQWNNIYLYLYEAWGKSPHVAFENRNIFFAIDFLAKLAINNENIERYRSLYLLFNEFWYDLYDVPIKPEITFLNESYNLNQKRKLIESINDVTIFSETDNYKCFTYKTFRKNQTYCIDVNKIELPNEISTFTVGLFDFGFKCFISKKKFRIGQNITLCFHIGKIVGNIGFCIWAGEHGHTAGIKMHIGEVQIYSIIDN